MLSAAVLAPLMIALVILGGVWYLGGIAVACGAAVWEGTALFGAFAEGPPGNVWRYLTVASGAVLLVGVQIGLTHPYATQVTVAALLVAGLAALPAGGAPARRYLHWALSVATLLYIVGLGAHFILLRALRQGIGWTLLACAITWGTDIGAFFVGRRFGKRPFFAEISPHKTVEGAAGGLAAGVVSAIIVIEAAGLHVPWYAAPLIGLTVSVLAQAGDLAESLLKREAGVKDSGTLIPGHGGVLDRIDSLLFAITVTFYWRLLFS